MIRVKSLLYTLQWEGNQYFYLAEIIGGTFGKGNVEEFMDHKRNRGTYEPVWVTVNSLARLDVRPKELVPILEGLVYV
ncbi:hypothetical protein [Alkalihalobacillus sp. AL-G]|uniref:hypothetical protein n=1 Tax=Alkalihalobacillus sp. AL-G TaxID=2926399 RepID=UPI00351AB21A